MFRELKIQAESNLFYDINQLVNFDEIGYI